VKDVAVGGGGVREGLTGSRQFQFSKVWLNYTVVFFPTFPHWSQGSHSYSEGSQYPQKCTVPTSGDYLKK